MASVVLNLCMIGAIVTAAFSFYSDYWDWYVALIMIAVEASTLVFVVF